MSAPSTHEVEEFDHITFTDRFGFKGRSSKTSPFSSTVTYKRCETSNSSSSESIVRFGFSGCGFFSVDGYLHFEAPHYLSVRNSHFDDIAAIYGGF